MIKRFYILLLAIVASVGMSWATENSIVINGTPQVGDNSISLTYYFDPANVPGITGYAPTLKVKCVTDNIWDEEWLSLSEISSGTQTINLSNLGSFQEGKSYDVCFAYYNGSWVDEVFQSFTPAAPAPDPSATDLASITGDYTVQDGEILTGTLGVNVKISIAPGATVTLNGVDINSNGTWTGGDYAGITCPGNATIILADGTVNRIKGFLNGNSAIHIKPNYTLTIEGDGTLYASTQGGAAAIGCGYSDSGGSRNGGNIVINGGTIYANGGSLAAGIGGGGRATIGNITINGGIIYAVGGGTGAGIGGGQSKNNSWKSICGNITISSNVKYLKATKGSGAAHSIGKGSSSYSVCGTVTIPGGATGYVSTSPYVYCNPDYVIELINAIPQPVVYTDECKAAIDEARAMYTALTDDQKTSVTNYSTLTDAEAAYAALLVEDKIAAIGTVELTAECKAKIDAARTAYDALSDEAKALVTNIATLTQAETDYAALAAAAAAPVIAQIEALPTTIKLSTYFSTYDLMVAARAAYNALSAEVQAAVTNLSKLTNLEDAFAAIGGANEKLSKPFSIGEGQVVYFAHGNLQATYNGTNWSWAFAAHQYDYIGDASGNIIINGNGTLSGAGTVDLFGWVANSSTVLTSGVAKYGVSNSDNVGDYGLGETETLKGDWGVAANDANIGGYNDWRILSNDEWVYLFKTRTDAASKYGYATVGGVNGVIIIPDAFTDPMKNKGNLAFRPQNVDKGYSTNVYTTGGDWEAMEAAGAVFMPAAGRRAGTAVTINEGTGFYWSSTPMSYQASYFMGFMGSNVVPNNDRYRYHGLSVRLVSNNAPVASTPLDSALVVKDLIEAIPAEITLEDACVKAINDAREAYNKLSEAAKGLLDEATIAKLTDAEAALTALNQAEADKVVAKIAAIPTPVELKLATRDSIESARAAYEALNAEQKALVPAADLQKLTDAEAALAALNPGGGAAPAGALNGAFTINESGDKIAFSKGNLQATTEDNGYNWTWSFAAHQWDNIGIEVANNKINGDGLVSENGTVDLFGWSTPVTYWGINNSVNVDDYILGDFKDWGALMGTGWRTLTKDEWTYLLQHSSNGRATVNDKIGYIFLPDNWSGPAFTANPSNWTTNVYSGDDWTAMENAGAVFLPHGYPRVGIEKKNTIASHYWSATRMDVDPKYAYAFFFSQYQAEAYMDGPLNEGCLVRLVAVAATPSPLDSAQVVKDLIEAIPAEITLEDACVNAVQAARDAYDALSDATKGALDAATVDKLNQAITDYTALIQAGADAVKAKIAAIPQPVTLKLATRDSIESARAAYDALTADQKLLVSNYQTLLDAEAALASLNPGVPPATPLDSAQAVKDLIDAIPVPVTLDDACVNAVQAARDAYDALSEDAKAILDAADVKKLTDAEAALTALNQAEADKVVAKINAIPLPVELKLATRDSIQNARAAYDALNATQQALVTNYQKLLDAEAALADLVPTPTPVPVTPTVWDMNSLKVGDIIYEGDQLTNMSSPRYINNVEVIRDDKSPYTLMKSAGETSYVLKDKDGSYLFTDGSLAITPTSVGLLVTNAVNGDINVVVYSPANVLDSAQAVKDLIEAIPTPVEYPTSGTAIAAALVAYQQLSDAAKGALDDADVQKMTDAATQYAALDAIAAIEEIPAEIVYDPAVKAAIETAREKYDALIDASKALVPEDKVDKLTNAEEAWAILVAKIEHNVSYIGKDGELKHETVALLHIPDPAPEFNGYEFVRWDVKAGDFLEEGLRIKAIYTPIITTNPVAYDTLVYNGTAQTLITEGVAKEGHIEYRINDGEWSTDLPQATFAAAYVVYYKLVREGHADYIADPINVTIAKAPVAYTAPTAYDTLVYTASNQTLIAAGQTQDGTFEYSLNPTLLDSWKAELPQAKDAGTYSVYYRVQGDLNHLDSVAATPVAVTIAKAALTATADDKNVIYGDAVPAYTVTYAGWQGNDDATVLTGNIAFACEYASTSNVGEYTITPSGVDAANYTITFVNGKVTVAKAESGCIAPVAFDTLVYNGANQTLIIAGQPMGGTMYYSLTGAAESWQTALPEAKEAGTYNVYYRVKGDGNHNDHDYDQPVAVTIAKAALTATADDKTVIYGDPIPAYSVTYAGWHGTDDASVLTGTIAYACTYAPLSNVGDYTIVPSGVDAANYAIQFINGTLTVNKAKVAYVAPVANELTYTAADQTLITAGTTNDGQFVYRLGVQGEYDGELPQATHVGTYEVYYKVLGDGNHLDSIIATPVTVSIAKAALTATADNKTVIFGENIPTYTVTYTGWLGEDGASVLTGAIAFACDYVKGSPVGEYVITPSGVDAADYAITFVNGTLTVNRKSAKSDDITAKQADNEKLVYDAAANKPTIIVKDTTLVLTENTDYKLTFIGRGNTEYAESATAPAHVGEYTAIVAFIGNYKDTLTVDFVINKAPLTITAEDKAITFGEYAPEFTVSYEGWQGTDTATVLTGVQAYACAYVRGNKVGDYTIIPSGVDAHDYAITFVNGTLTVNRKSAKDADIAAKQADNEVLVYDAEVNRPTIIVKDTTLVLTEAQDYVLTFKGVAADQSIYAESETAPTHVGNYTAIVAFIGNYIDTLTVDFVINKAPLTITANDTAMIYGDVAPEFTVSYAGWFGNDDESVLLGTQAYDCVYAPGSPIGTYVITPKGVDAYDYAITFVNGTLTVNKAHVYVSGAEAHNAKFADGHAIADVTNQGVLNGIKLNDPIAHVTTAAFSSADVAEHLTITLFYELTGDAALLNNYNLDPTSEIFTTEGVIIEPFIPDDDHQPGEEEQVEVQEGIDVYAYGYCDGSAYSLKYHLNSGNPDQYKIDFDDARFSDVDWTNLTTVGKDGTIDIDIPVDMPTGDYTMTVYFRDSRFTWLESKAINVTFHVNLPETYVRPLFDNVIAVVDTCRCLTDIQWYWRANSSDPWQPIPGANGYYYHSEGKLTGEYFVSAKMNGVPTYTCGQADMETLYGDKTKKQAQVKAYPNPVQDKTNVTIEGSTEWVHNLRIVSLMGVEMDNMTFEGDETIVDMNAYPQGNYMISVDGIVVKVMKQ